MGAFFLFLQAKLNDLPKEEKNFCITANAVKQRL